MTTSDLANILLRHGLIQLAAIEDPEGYDGGATRDAIACAADEITGHIPEIRPCPFCGHPPTISYGKAKCTNDACKVQPKTKTWFVNNHDAVTDWNQRASARIV